MTKIRLQDNSTEEDDDAGASEHYDGILPMSSSTASDSDYDFHAGSLSPVTPNLYGKEVSSEAKENNLWSHYAGVSTERQTIPGVGILGHPWTDILTVSRKTTTSLVPKNMFGRSVEQVVHSPDLPASCFESLASPSTYSSTQSGHSTTIITDHSCSHLSPSLDVGIEVRRHLGDELHLAGNHQNTIQSITSAPSLAPESHGPHPEHSFSNLAEAVTQEALMEGPIAGGALPFTPPRSIEGSASSEPCRAPLEEPCLISHSSTPQSKVSIVSVARPNLRKSVDGQLKDSAAIKGLSQSHTSPRHEDSGSDGEEERETRHPGRRSDKKRKPPRIYTCPEPWCKATFTRSNDVERHRLNAAIHKRANKDTSTCCQKCGEELSRPDARRRHERKGSCGKRKINRKPPYPLALA